MTPIFDRPMLYRVVLHGADAGFGHGDPEDLRSAVENARGLREFAAAIGNNTLRVRVQDARIPLQCGCCR